MATTQERAQTQTPQMGPAQEPEYRSLRQDVWRQFKRHKGALIGLIILTIIVVATVLGPFIYPMDPFEIDVANANMPPSADHLMGTDNLGRDVMARVLIGGRISLSVGFAAMIFGVFLGTTIGILSGFFRRLDGPLMRITDLFLALPILPLLLVVIMLFREPLKEALGPELGIFLLVVFIIGVTSWMQTARVVRGDVLSIKEEEFVLAAHSVGTKKRNIILRHILPNTLSPVMVSAALGVAVAILTESALSFLGLGFPPDFPTWGRLLFDAKDYLQLSPMRVLWPGVMISLTVLSVNFIGDGLRDALDPKLRSK
jgi:peptide/nickel transport system permease protein